MKTVLSVIALMLLPSLSAAAGCSTGHEQAMSCAEGAVWDSESQSCVPQVTS